MKLNFTIPSFGPPLRIKPHPNIDWELLLMVSMRASFICWSRLLEETEGGVKEEKNYRE
jgi:hypothetical protein